MKTYDILKQEEEMCNTIWRDNYEKEIKKGNIYTSLGHDHVCDFELLLWRMKPKERAKIAKKRCIKYLASLGMERDKYMECCDYCLHDRYITYDADGFILNIATLAIDVRMKE